MPRTYKRGDRIQLRISGGLDPSTRERIGHVERIHHDGALRVIYGPGCALFLRPINGQWRHVGGRYGFTAIAID